MNVLKQHLQSAIFTLLERGVSQHRIHELTGIDRKTIRRYQALHEAQQAGGANSSTAAIRWSRKFPHRKFLHCHDRRLQAERRSAPSTSPDPPVSHIGNGSNSRCV